MFFLNSIEYLQDKQNNKTEDDGWSNIYKLVDYETQLKEATEVEVNLITKEDDNPIIEIKKSSYTPACRKAQQKYREKFPEKYCALQRKLYQDKKNDDEWKKKFNERSKVNNAKYREKKMKEFLDAGGEVKPKGRPKKVKDIVVDTMQPIKQYLLDDSSNEDVKPIVEEKTKRKYVKKEKKV
jgi:hypothetical protein